MAKYLPIIDLKKIAFFLVYMFVDWDIRLIPHQEIVSLSETVTVTKSSMLTSSPRRRAGRFLQEASQRSFEAPRSYCILFSFSYILSMIVLPGIEVDPHNSLLAPAKRKYIRFK